MSLEIGSYLRQARESIGLSIGQLEEMTKIRCTFLVAIEKGEFHKLPGPFYVRTYLRSYANCVKIEPHHILRQYRKEEQAERGLTGTHPVVDMSSSQVYRSGLLTAATQEATLSSTGPRTSVQSEEPVVLPFRGAIDDIPSRKDTNRTSSNQLEAHFLAGQPQQSVDLIDRLRQTALMGGTHLCALSRLHRNEHHRRGESKSKSVYTIATICIMVGIVGTVAWKLFKG